MIINTNKEITNIQIMNIANLYGINKHMLSIIMKDQVQLIKKNHYYIINLDNENGKGTHWTALICNSNSCFYCDSYGTPPPQKLVQKLKRMYGEINFSDFIIQDVKSVACGYYALSVILVYHMYRNDHKLLEIVSRYLDYFNDDTKKNDQLLQRLFNYLSN
jgi:hypothetical protein